VAPPLTASAFRIAAPALTVVLVEPQIPPNTGNIARLCAATRCHLILAGKLGFELSDARLKRAGLDYWDFVSWEHDPDVDACLARVPEQRLHLLTRHATRPYTGIAAQAGDWLVFGKETTGLGRALLDRFPARWYTIPMAEPRVRSLNLSSAVAVVLYDSLWRLGRLAPEQ
jgi:tRNA (cytidine/uridine-2'-O-)-methyltransferase